MKNCDSNTENSREWPTPPETAKALGPFDPDPRAPANRPWDTAARHHAIGDDGLSRPWEGRVWLNPPGATVRRHQRRAGAAMIPPRRKSSTEGGIGPITLELPFPPSVNHYWRHVLFGGSIRTIISKPGKIFRNAVIQAVKAQNMGLMLAGRLSVRVILCPPDDRIRDVDNFGGKALLDALTHAGVWRDDNQVKRLTMEWGEKFPEGRTFVRITAL